MHVNCLYGITELMKAWSWVVILITVLRYSHVHRHCSTIHIHKVLTDINIPSSMNVQVAGLVYMSQVSIITQVSSVLKCIHNCTVYQCSQMYQIIQFVSVHITIHFQHVEFDEYQSFMQTTVHI